MDYASKGWDLPWSALNFFSFGLVVNDFEPSKAVGSVSFTEIFVTVSETLTFLVLLGPENFYWEIILGLIIGGLICAPFAAFACKRLPHRALGILVGVTIIILSIRTILTFLDYYR